MKVLLLEPQEAELLKAGLPDLIDRSVSKGNFQAASIYRDILAMVNTARDFKDYKLTQKAPKL